MSIPIHDNILQIAESLVTGDRAAAYGHPRVNWERTAKIASATLGIELTPAQCVLFAISMKLARLQNTPDHRDSIVDIAGYAYVLDRVVNG